MSNFEETIGSGLSKIQDGLDKGKNKVGLMKEISRLNKIIEDANVKKTEVLIELGISAYKKIREELIVDSELVEKSQSIMGFDYIIYNNKRKIENLKIENEGFKCSCGNTLNYQDKFCGGCGKKVEIKSEDIECITCINCEAEIVSGSTFCPCCGLKIK